ncbi:MAG TPA: hypothetical protein VMW17_12390 [Candidatus Binatia bacterium]|nr:hypothetical protein [Candidatus Binatia bacterium]
MLWWLRDFCTAEPLISSDLPGHVAVVERMIEQLRHGRIFFYDPRWFAGWPVGEFYALLAHLVAAMFALLLTPFSQSAPQLAVNLMCLAACSLLPLSMTWAWTPLVREICGGDRVDAGIELVGLLWVGALTLWYLNSDDPGFGLGVDGAFLAGLFPQVFGWHLVLLYVGVIYRAIEHSSVRREVALGAIVGLLLLTHTLSAVYAVALGAMAALRFRSVRAAIVRAHLFGVGIAAFWLLPAIRYASDYTMLETESPGGDLLALLFRYPLPGLVATLASWIHGRPIVIDPTPLAAAGFALVLAFSSQWVRRPLLTSFGFFVVLLYVVFSSGFTAASLPIGLHFYRFTGLAFLMAVHLLSVAPVIVLQWAQSRRLVFVVARLVLLVVSLFGVLATTLTPPWKLMVVRSTNQVERFRAERAVLEHLRTATPTGRVYVERAMNRQKFRGLSPHFLTSELFPRSGRETVNGLFIQSSLSSRYASASALRLGARIYGGPYPTEAGADWPAATAIQQLRDSGVTHVVASEAQFLDQLRPFGVAPPVRFEPYDVVQIAAQSAPLVRTLDKPVVGYLDLTGTAPFKQVGYFFYSHEPLASGVELLDLTLEAALPAEVATVIVNGPEAAAATVVGAMTARRSDSAVAPRTMTFNFSGTEAIDPYNIRYVENPDTDRYQQLEALLDRVLPLGELSRPVAPAKPGESLTPTLEWSADFQRMTLSGLHPGRLVRLNYTYFPYWSSPDADLFRGSVERMYVLPHNSTATLTYSRRTVSGWWIGDVVSALSLAALWLRARTGATPS